MFRQRIHLHTAPLAWLGRLLLVVFACALVWYGAMLLALAFKAPPDTIDLISGYRTAYDFLAGLEEGDISGLVRLIIALGGLIAFVLFGLLALKEIPRPHLARTDLVLSEEERAVLTVEPRAIERAAEVAALQHSSVSEASGRYGDDGINVRVHVKRAANVAETLRDVHRRVAEALRTHDLPPSPVSVTLTGFDRQKRKELA
jgi:hypothetical protein